MDDLSFNWVVLDSLLEAFDWHVLNVLILEDLWDVFGLVFDCVVIRHVALPGDLNALPHFLVFDDRAFVGNVLNSGFTSNRLLLDSHRLNSYRLNRHRLLDSDRLWLVHYRLGIGHHRLSQRLHSHWRGRYHWRSSVRVSRVTRVSRIARVTRISEGRSRHRVIQLSRVWWQLGSNTLGRLRWHSSRIRPLRLRLRRNVTHFFSKLYEKINKKILLIF